MIALLLSLCTASAAEYHVVHSGETIESLVPDPAVAARVRADNQLAPGENPPVGRVLLLPDRPDHDEVEALITAVSGTVTVKLPGGTAHEATEGEKVPVGSTVCTQTGSYAAIRLGVAADSEAHDELALLAETCMVVDATSGGAGRRESLVSVLNGGVTVREADDPNGTVAIQAVSGVMAGSGGGFRVTVEDGAARAEAVGAAIRVFGAGVEQPLQKGYGSRVVKGQAPSPPQKLLDPGTPISPSDGATLKRPDFSWEPFPRALGYRVEIAATSDFMDIVVSDDVGDTIWKPDLLFAPGHATALYWRVSVFDRLGFLGLPSESRRLEYPPPVIP